MSNLGFRSVNKADLPFIFRSWLKTYKQSLFAKDLDPKIYYSVHHKIIEVILNRANVIIAFPAGNPDSIAGFLVCEKNASVPIIHYCYVRFSMQGFGVAKEMLKTAGLDPISTPIQYSHQESTKKPWLRAKYPLLQYNPYAI